MDAIRYAISTHMRGNQEAGYYISKASVYI